MTQQGGAPDLACDQARRALLRRYADAIVLWGRRYDTQEIARELGVPEHMVARWIANFREQMRAA